MSKVRTACYSISVDGYGAGPDQSLDQPLGIGGEAMHTWRFVDHGQAAHEFERDLGREFFDGVGAFILGRNMFGPVRGPWPDVAPHEEWRGWWGPNPPYHTPVFVLTHHAHDPIEMEGGTTFHFVTDGIESALTQARAAAGELDVNVAGGAETIRQYVRAGLIDSLHFAVAPVLLGGGERLFGGLPTLLDDYELTNLGQGGAAHYRLTRRTPTDV